MADEPKPTTDYGGDGSPRRDLSSINEEARRIFVNTLDRQQKIRKMLRHELKAPMMKEFVDEGAEYFQIDMERKYQRSKEVMASFSKRWPTLIRRHPMGTGPATNSTKIEQGVTAIMRSDQRGVGWPKEAVVDCVVNEGAGCVITQPATTYWQNIPKSASLGRRVIQPQYRVDSKGRYETDDYYKRNKKRTFEVDRARSRGVFDEHVDWLKAREIPIVQRSISLEQGLPFFGSKGEIAAYIVSSQYAVPTLARDRMAWWDDEHKIMMGYGGASGAGVSTRQPSSTMRTVYEFWYYDTACEGMRDDESSPHPCVEYQVEKCDTYRVQDDGTLQNARVCFWCKFRAKDGSPGITRLPIAWSPGQGWPGSANPDDWCVGLPWDYLQNDLALDNLLTGLAVAFWRVGFPTFHAKPDPVAVSLPESDAEQDEPDPIVIKPLQMIRSSDTITQIAGQAPSSDGMKLVAFIDGSSEAQSPSITGGGGSDSALAQATSAQFGRDELALIDNAILRLYSESSSHVAEAAYVIGKKDSPIAIFEQVETPIATIGSNHERPSLRPLTIEPSWFGSPPVFDMTAELPIRPGDNIPLTQQLADMRDRGIVDTRFVHEHGLGITDSEIMQARVEAEQIRNEPAGRARTLALVAQIQGDEEEAEQAKLKAAQLLSEALGLPTAMGGALPPPGPEAQAMMMQQAAMGGAPVEPFQGGGMTGTGVPEYGANALAGQVGGAMAGSAQAQAADLGVSIPMGTGG